jgi:hypothetical protein
MERLKKFTIAGILFVLATGTLAHFLYGWTGNNAIAGLFVPVNESIWEHMKLLFFPMVLYSLLMLPIFQEEYPCIASSLSFGILVGTILIPVLFYAYNYILGKDIFILDIGIFIVSTVIAFYLAYKFTLSCKLKPYSSLLFALAMIFFLCFILFTYQPPNLKIFAAPEKVAGSIESIHIIKGVTSVLK